MRPISGESDPMTGTPAAMYSNSLLGSVVKYDSEEFTMLQRPTSAEAVYSSSSRLGTGPKKYTL